ncbi:acyl-CoA dehydrogenase [Pullulanibacillus sp. KACC 23026]|uniref:acyl-CoA dehydrogenase n=1 Tax=Pullulanibacillus sp. KACC 23026 TaxID=3028315 RepID=UPI0023B14580|nr:acyl-CoA dehydrogenase [Pullulanibacillus sp. KACC 23026]WEG12216.1 acyl-CoA dehydrogenase [Pullulanibacillus sp. KACC 23026]
MINHHLDIHLIDPILKDEVEPFIGKIDQMLYYPGQFLKSVGRSGLLLSAKLPIKEVRQREVQLIEKTATYCMTSAFLLWCHLAALTAVRMSTNPYIKEELLPLLESGKVLGGTGLSNALKYYAGIGTIQLKAERTKGGYFITGSLPSVSNLGDGHWFTILASLDDQHRLLGILPAEAEGLRLEEKNGFVGMNGTRTFSCSFNNVFLPDKWILTEDPDDFIQQIRPSLVLYQIPLGLGVASASIDHLSEVRRENADYFEGLNVQPEDLGRMLQEIQRTTYDYSKLADLVAFNQKILLTRLEIIHLTSQAVHNDMLYSGGRAYLKDSDPFRRLRESYFLFNLTPTVKQLENLRQSMRLEKN